MGFLRGRVLHRLQRATILAFTFCLSVSLWVGPDSHLPGASPNTEFLWLLAGAVLLALGAFFSVPKVGLKSGSGFEVATGQRGPKWESARAVPK